MASSNKRILRSVTKQLKSEYFIDKPKHLTSINESIKIRKKNNGTQQIIKPEYDDESEPNIKLEQHEQKSWKPPHDDDESEPNIKLEQHEQKSWKPPHWKKVYENIKEMRAKRDAAVDHMGAEKCSDKNTPPKVQRFHTLIGLMLSSQTRDGVTHAAVTKLKEHGLTVSNILNTSKDVIEKLIYPVGFYKSKAGYVLKTCQILKDKYDSDIPPTLKELCSLPGVGYKMAYLCMDIAWNKMEGIGVDTHVHRISNRLGWTGKKPTKTPENTRKALEDWLPKDHWREVNLLLVGFGQQICLPVNPKCSDCLNKQLCLYGSNPSNRSKKSSTLKTKQES